jgi:DNA-binding NarL/FixJ family response regulator
MSPPRARLRVLVVDDHAGFRAAAKALLEAAGYLLVGEAEDGPSAVELTAALRPDVLVLDVQLPGLDGFAVADAVARQPDHPAVVLVSSHDAGTYGRRLVDAPVAGFLTKAELSGRALARLLG